jgi:hypothetical protein
LATHDVLTQYPQPLPANGCGDCKAHKTHFTSRAYRTNGVAASIVVNAFDDDDDDSDLDDDSSGGGGEEGPWAAKEAPYTCCSWYATAI